MTKRLILMLLLSCSPLWATTYYVDNCLTVGNDSNNGTSPSTPWLTINKVNTSKFNPGDSILFESTCTWREQLNVPSSGSAGSPITFGAYGAGAAPAISGSDLLNSWTLESQGSFNAYYASQLVTTPQILENGVRLAAAVSKAALTPGSFWWDSGNLRAYVRTYEDASPASDTIEAAVRATAVTVAAKPYVSISGLELRGATTYGLLATGNIAGLAVVGDTIRYNYSTGVLVPSVTRAYSLLFENNHLAYNGAGGFGGGSTTAASLSGWQFLNNTVDHNSQVQGIFAGDYQFTAGIYVGCGSGTGPALIAGNLVTYGASTYVPGSTSESQGVGIWSDSCNSVSITQNYIASNWGAGVMIEKNVNSSVTYNVLSGNDIEGSTGGIDSVAYATGNIWLRAGESSNSTGCIIANNTSYGGGLGINIQSYDTSTISDTQTANNIAVGALYYQLYAGPGGNNDGTHGSGNVYSHNGFGAASSTLAYWTGAAALSTYAALDSAYGSVMSNMQGNPQFSNAAASHFWLASGSPAIGAGLNLGSPYNIGVMPGSTWPNSVVRGDQNAYGSGWEIGAFVYVPAGPAPPSNLQAVAH